MIIDGRAIAQKKYNELRSRVQALPFVPVFCDILIGNDPASRQYVAMKARAAESVGMRFLRAEFPGTIDEGDLIQSIGKLNNAPDLCGLILQLPLPAGLDTQKLLDAIDPRLDVDCLSTTNSLLFYEGKSPFIFPTAAAVMTILDSLPVQYAGKHFVVMGRGILVGKPVRYLLEERGFSVDVVNRATVDVPALTRNADVVIAATGKPGILKGEMIKPGAVVIDAGTAEWEGGIVGDVEFDSVSKVASYISPVPGGVGPVTVAQLLENVVISAERSVL